MPTEATAGGGGGEQWANKRKTHDGWAVGGGGREEEEPMGVLVPDLRLEITRCQPPTRAVPAAVAGAAIAAANAGPGSCCGSPGLGPCRLGPGRAEQSRLGREGMACCRLSTGAVIARFLTRMGVAPQPAPSRAAAELRLHGAAPRHAALPDHFAAVLRGTAAVAVEPVAVWVGVAATGAAGGGAELRRSAVCGAATAAATAFAAAP